MNEEFRNLMSETQETLVHPRYRGFLLVSGEYFISGIRSELSSAIRTIFTRMGGNVSEEVMAVIRKTYEKGV